MSHANIRINGANFEHIGWKYYNSIIKKAMEQEFSWSGLSLSLSIAFFVVIVSAQALSLTYKSLARIEENERIMNTRVYQIERIEIKSQVQGIQLVQLT